MLWRAGLLDSLFPVLSSPQGLPVPLLDSLRRAHTPPQDLWVVEEHGTGFKVNVCFTLCFQRGPQNSEQSHLSNTLTVGETVK